MVKYWECSVHTLGGPSRVPKSPLVLESSVCVRTEGVKLMRVVVVNKQYLLKHRVPLTINKSMCSS